MNYLGPIGFALVKLFSSVSKTPPLSEALTKVADSQCSSLSSDYEKVLAAIAKKVKVVMVHGRAGTGKTTLIQKIVREGKLNHVIVAPTGVAALNAGGQTIHSFFALPPHILNLSDIEPRSRLQSIVKRLELIIIDEISMVRADLLDAIDQSLRINCGNNLPFGGIPMLLVGDFLQLPPVVDREEEEILRMRGYESYYAFGAKCLQGIHPFIIELSTVYRQTDSDFIDILGHIRFGKNVDRAVAELNDTCHGEHRRPSKPIVLTSTNAAADTHNRRGLATLPDAAFTYLGSLEGDFQLKKIPPAPERLELKVGARVMLVKNDPQKRWVNGSLGTVTRCSNDGVRVRLDSSLDDFQIDRAKWESIRYGWDASQQRVASNVIGTYTQLPILPAWAITIHKSQGLTLEDVRVDLQGGAFSSGQTYVALSRVKSLQGLSLAKPLTIADVKVDLDLVDAVKSMGSNEMSASSQS